MKDIDFCPAGAIFDMDGLMLETERPLIPLWIEAGRLFGREIKEETVHKAIGKTGKDVRAVCIEDLGWNFPYDEFHNTLHYLITTKLEKGIAVKPGLVFLLDCLSARNIPVIVATSTRREQAVWKLEKAGIAERLPVMVCGDEIRKGKPDPEIFLAAAEKLKLSPSCCVGFEDSPAGLLGLHAAGIRSVFVKDVIEPPNEVLSTVWKRYGSLAEAAELFQGNAF